MPDRPRYSSPLAWFRHGEGRDEDAPLSAEARFSEILAELPAVERSALALSEIGGLDEEEIAERLGTTVPVVRSLLLRARSAARSRLRERTGLAALVPQLVSWLPQGGAPARAAGVVAAAVVGAGAVATTVPEAAAERPVPERAGTVELVRESPRPPVELASSPVPTVAVERRRSASGPTGPVTRKRAVPSRADARPPAAPPAASGATATGRPLPAPGGHRPPAPASPPPAPPSPDPAPPAQAPPAAPPPAKPTPPARAPLPFVPPPPLPPPPLALPPSPEPPATLPVEPPVLPEVVPRLEPELPPAPLPPVALPPVG